MRLPDHGTHEVHPVVDRVGRRRYFFLLSSATAWRMAARSGSFAAAAAGASAAGAAAGGGGLGAASLAAAAGLGASSAAATALWAALDGCVRRVAAAGLATGRAVTDTVPSAGVASDGAAAVGAGADGVVGADAVRVVATAAGWAAAAATGTVGAAGRDALDAFTARVRPSATPPMTATVSPATASSAMRPPPPRRAAAVPWREAGGATVVTAGGTVMADTLELRGMAGGTAGTGEGARAGAGAAAGAAAVRATGAGRRAAGCGALAASLGIVDASLARSFSSRRMFSRVVIAPAFPRSFSARASCSRAGAMRDTRASQGDFGGRMCAPARGGPPRARAFDKRREPGRHRGSMPTPQPPEHGRSPSGAGPEDELDPLPPLDGDGRDEPEAEEGDFGDALADDGAEASLDDATAEDDSPDASELEVDEGDEGWLDEAPDAPDLDIGGPALVDFGDEDDGMDDDDPPDGGDEDYGFGGGPERGDLDGGDEGPLDADEELKEADLPALDADDQGEVDDSSLVDPGFGSDEPLGVPWAAEPWSRVGAPLALASATAVACAGRGALVVAHVESGAAELLRIDLEGTCQGLAATGLDVGAVRALGAAGDLVAAALEDGRMLWSRDGGASFAPVGEGVAAADVVVASTASWARTPSGGLLAIREDGTVLARGATPGTVAALARDGGGGAAALVVDEAGRPVAVVRGRTDGSVAREVLPPPEAPWPVAFAARGEHVAYAARRDGVVRRVAGGRWAQVSWGGQVTALAFVDEAGSLVAATYSDADDTTALVRVDATGEPRVVALVGPGRADADGDGRVTAMAYDDARGVVWVVGGLGVAAFAVR